MRHRFSIVYAAAVRFLTIFLPDFPILMRFRGFLYSLGMERCGGNFQVASSVYLNSLAGMRVGRDVYVAHNTVIIGVDVEIGDEAIIGPNCVISGGNHRFSRGSFRFAKSSVEPVRIGAGSWVAANCTITGGGVLPPESVLAAGAVLTKAFADRRAVYRGVPARMSHYHQDDMG